MSSLPDCEADIVDRCELNGFGNVMGFGNVDYIRVVSADYAPVRSG